MTSPAIARLRIFSSLLLAAACGGGKDVGPNQPPVAAAGGPYTTNTGAVSFDGSASSDPDGDALTYSWDFGDGENGRGARPMHTYRATGSFTVRLTVTDARGGTSAPASTSAQVSNVGPTVEAGTSKAVPVGSSYALSATFTDGAEGPWDYTIQWGDGTTSDGDRGSPGTITATHAYASEAGYRVVVNVTDRFGAQGSDSLTITATPPVLVGAGDIGDCLRTGDDSTGALLDRIEGIVMPLGDNAYLDGTPEEYANCYDPAWGRHKARSRPVAGNHDYNTPGATGYYGYFGAAAGDPAKGYYSYTLGSWFVIVLNTGTDSPPNYAVGSPQEQWLRAELASHSQQCVLAMFHHPRFSTTLGRGLRPEVKPLWDALYEYGADLVINGHDHSYQRFAPQKPDGTADPAYGIRQITVGTGGGEGLYQWGDVVPNLDVRDNETWGVIKVTLRQSGYDWQFVPVTGKTFTDSGSGTCHGRPM
ncbi:MAG: PKD domain-containing protein [Gemmatimonadales bacterium]